MYQFDPPGRSVSMDPTGKDTLWSRVTYLRGDAVVRFTNGSFRQVATHDPDLADIDVVYLGGHVHTISDEDAALLTAAGYGQYLTAVI